MRSFVSRWAAVKNPEKAVDLVVKTLIAGALIVLALNTLESGRQDRATAQAQVCRFEISADVNSISDQIDAKIAEVVVAASQGDDAAVAKAGQELEVLVDRLYPAIQDRNRAVESCRE